MDLGPGVKKEARKDFIVTWENLTMGCTLDNRIVSMSNF